MKCIDALREEHKTMIDLLVALAGISARLRAHEPVQARTVERLVEIVHELMDECHHVKEEQVLFPALRVAGLKRTDLEAVKGEHETGDELLRDMTAELVTLQGSDTSRKKFVYAADKYCELLKEHITEEECVLFPTAEKLLKPEDDERLLEAFERAEQKNLGPGTHACLDREIERLAHTQGKST